MKQIQFLSLCAFAALTFAACSLDQAEQTYHVFQIDEPSNQVCELYADETVDTIVFTTTENWESYASTSWITINSNSTEGTVPSGYYTSFPIYFTTSVNTTGEFRRGAVDILLTGSSYSRTGGVYVEQYPVHCVSSAQPLSSNSENTKYYYLQQDSARQTSDVLTFTTHFPWTLTTSVSTMKSIPDNTVTTIVPVSTSGAAGTNSIQLKCDTTFSHLGDTIYTTLYLETSHDNNTKVTTPIKFIQIPKRKN